MPLTPATTDKLYKVGLPGSATTLAAPGYTTGVTTAINVGATTNWPTDTPTVFAMDAVTVVNGVATRTPGTYGEFFGIVTGSTTIGSLALLYGTPQNYVAGSLTRVYIPVSGSRENALIDAIRQDHNGKGNHQTLTDDNNNAWLTRSQVAAAVNSVQVSNAIATTAPGLAAVGTDTNIDLLLTGKGTGLAKTDGMSPLQFAIDSLADFVVSGGALVISSGLIGTFSNIVYYIGGKRYSISSVPNKTYTVSKDTYVDVNTSQAVVYTEVANGAASPALAANHKRLGKVITSGAAITMINQQGYDSNNVRYHNTVTAMPSGMVNSNTTGTFAFSATGDTGMKILLAKPKDIMTLGSKQVVRFQPYLRVSGGGNASYYRIAYVMRVGSAYANVEPSSGTTVGQTSNYQTITAVSDAADSQYWADYDLSAYTTDAFLRIDLHRDGAGGSDTAAGTTELEGCVLMYCKDYTKTY